MGNKHLQFSEDKCDVKKIPSLAPLYLNATELKHVTNYKYLGILITNSLSWQPHQCVTVQES